MSILFINHTPGTRNRALSAFSEITKAKPEKATKIIVIKEGNRGKLLLFVIEGGGHKRSYRLIDFKTQ
jgi:large subunit ribosomal protein L2